jgi:hypothetical protein
MFFLSYHLKQINYTKLNTVFVPDMGAGRCLGPEGNGASLGKGGEGPAPQEARKISSQCSAREEATWRRKKKEGQVGRDEGGPERTE